MSVTAAGSTLGVRYNPAGRLEFHVRLAELPPEEVPVTAPSTAASVTPVMATRGMEILNGILDKRGQSAWRRFARYCWMNRLWVLCALMIGLCGLALALGFAQEDELAALPAERETTIEDVFADSELIASPQQSTAGVAAPQISPATAVIPATDPRDETDVQRASFQTTQSSPTRAVWLEGTILSDDPPNP